MKDLTHYFMDIEKTPEMPKIQATRVTNGSTDAAKSVEQTAKKRGRVKIKITQNNEEERVCDIVESKHDLVDKTPSPFAGGKEKNGGSYGEETPKRSGVLGNGNGNDQGHDKGNCNDNDNDKGNDKGDCNGKDNENGKFDDETDDSDALDSSGGRIFSPPRRSEKNGDEGVEGSENLRRESSNAFQVLMTRSKPVQYVPQKSLSPEAEAIEAKNAEKVKMKMRKNKEKLVELADKKGYSKRKLAEAEEGEMIEKRLENRAKVFKRLKKDEEAPVKGNERIVSGGLHNYFNKTTPEEREKEKLLALSTVTVKAEIHGAELVKEASKIVIKPRNSMKAVKNKTRKVLAAIDDIQVLRSETPSPPPVVVLPEVVPVEEPKVIKKAKWSLRINLSEVEESKDEDQEMDEQPVPKVHSKSKKAKKKEKNRKNSVKNEEKRSSTPETPAASLEESVEIIDPPDSSQDSKKLPRSDSEPIFPAKIIPEPPDILEIHSQPLAHSEIIEIKVQKLAPLFMKRQKPDPEVVAARRNFLYSKPPEDSKEKSGKKSPVPGASALPFPSISHITQLSPIKNPQKSPQISKIPLRVPSLHTSSLNPSDFKSLNTAELPKKPETQENPQKSPKPVQEDVLSEIEARCADARDLWTAITSAHNKTTKESPKRRGRKRKSTEKSTKQVQVEQNMDHIIWTHKYRPLSAKQIVGNEDAAMKLKTWLEAWRIPLKEDYSSGEEFYSSDNSFASNLETNQVAVLLGPHGSGKTASVYAIAEELGYTVLELNASSKRPGKKILKELEEATKSHRIKKSDLKAQILPKSQAMPQNSLILVEDVDLVFDEDEGFVSATYQLASNTKRPIVMTCRSTCMHLNRMAPQQMRIYYKSICGDRVAALLEMIALAEAGTRLPASCLEKLLSKGDLRKALLQLQYLVLSGKVNLQEIPQEFGQTFWQDVRSRVYKPAIKCEKKMGKKKKDKLKERQEKEINEKDSNFDVLESLSNDLETISIFSNFVEIDDCALNISEVKFEPSISLIENEDLYSSGNAQLAEISDWLRHRVMNKCKENVKEERQNSNQFLLVKKELNYNVNLALSQVASNNLDSYSIRTDYLPIVRTICRAEETRITSNSKRGNRFFHYLQNLRLPAASTKSNVLAAACKVMQDENPQLNDL